jgi:hypothetical protein
MAFAWWRRVALLAALGVTAWWAGEDVMQPFEMIALSVLMGAASAVLMAYVSARSWVARVGWAVASLAVAAVAHQAGSAVAQRAFNDCVSRGEDVRAALLLFREARGRYPDRLAELPGIRIPGQRWIRPGLLHYRATSTGYDMYFRDWLVTFDASEGRGFGGRK